MITPAVIEDMVNYFAGAELYKEAKELIYLKDGEIRETTKEVPCSPPMLSSFCRSKGIRYTDLKKAAQVIPELADALDECSEIIKEFLVHHGLLGTYAAQYGIFATKNLTDWKDVQSVEKKTVDVNKLADFLEGKNNSQKKFVKSVAMG